MAEKHYRSIIKGISWRIVGTLDTIIIATLWTGDYSKALKIGFIEVFTKIILYYFHERLWMKVKWNRGHIDAHGKSVTKGISWRVVAAVDTFLISLYILHENVGMWQLAAKITGTELVTKVPLFYLHERLWIWIKWGKKTPTAIVLDDKVQAA